MSYSLSVVVVAGMGLIAVAMPSNWGAGDRIGLVAGPRVPRQGC